MLPAAGSRVGPYEIQELRGQGGMGAVYRARDTRLRRDVALKFLLDGGQGTGRSRLLREARAASALNHPNICAIYDVGEANDSAYIAMELIDGSPITADMPPGGFDAATLIDRSLQVVDGLAHAHAQGIVHRDLKSANILRSSSGRVKLLDFGLALHEPSVVTETLTRSADSLRKPGLLAGTLAWMAPEVLRHAQADARSDLWALGVLMFELATGDLPFRGTSSFELASEILHSPPPPLPARLPAELQEVIRKLLEKDPALRYQSATEVRAALEVVRSRVRDGSGEPRTVGARTRRRRAWSGTRAWVLLAATITAALVWAINRPTAGLRLGEQRLLSVATTSQSSPSLSPDGRTIAFVAPDDAGVPQIWIQALGGGGAVAITSGELPASRPRWSPQQNEIYFSREGQGVWIVSPLGGAPRRVLAAGTNPSLSIDGARLVYEHQNRIWVANADGSAATRLDHVPPKYYSVPSTPAFSPDGREIVYFLPEAGPNGDFWIASVDGSAEPRRLTHDLREGGSPLWLTTGTIIFSSARAGSRTLWQIPSDGGMAIPLTTGVGQDDEPEMSRDGRSLVYSNVRHRWELAVGQPEGQETRLFERRTEILFPQFSPDGTTIAFFGRNDKAVAIFTVRTDGSQLRQLTAGIELNHMPRWSPDGQWVYFFQVAPERSFRRVAAVGGPSEAVLPFEWQRQNFPQFHPKGVQLVYARLGPDGDATIVRDLSTGAERILPGPALREARFAPDGEWLVGRRGASVVVCRADGADCSTVADGRNPAWSGDGSRIYFLKMTSTEDAMWELWSVTREGADPRQHRLLGPFGRIDEFFDVSRNDQVTWAPFHAGTRELWLAQVR